MRGKGKSVRHPQSSACSGRNALKRCNNNEKTGDVVVIDVDSDTLSNNVVIIDVPESSKKKLRRSSAICIDDDENSGNNHAGIDVENGCDFSDEASSSERFSGAFNHTHNSVDAIGDECQFVQEKFSPFKLSKCKRTYSGKASGRNRYGLGPESFNSGPSVNDVTDCDFMEDSFGKLREEWEKANMKKKHDLRSGVYGRHDEATTTGFHIGAKKNVELENPIDQHTDAQVSCSSSTGRCGEESPSPFVQTSDGNSGSTFDKSKKTLLADFGLKSTQETHFSNSKGNNQESVESSPVEAEGQINKHKEHAGSSFIDEEDQCSKGTSLYSIHEQGNKQDDHTKKSSQHKEKMLATTTSNSGDKEKMVCEQSSSQNIEPCCEMRSSFGIYDTEVGAAPEENLLEVPSWGKSGIGKERGFCQDTAKQVPKEPSSYSISHTELHTEPIIGSSKLSCEIFIHKQQEEKDTPFHSQDGDVMNALSSLIDEREKLKETDEYKRAVEEEWASRKRELQLQAEEAKKMRRLRKRMTAESLRLLDMEKRQKQRVEEMREVQKKDEENMNMKEQLRAEVRKELNILENTCEDMASLLRCLGIQLYGGLKPLPQEVRAAYKRALLSFHPDRASGSGIRQLVEAEEKFKLISRMKDKYLMTS